MNHEQQRRNFKKQIENKPTEPQTGTKKTNKIWKVASSASVALVLISMIGWGLFESIFGQQVGFVAKVGKKLISEREFGSYVDAIEAQFKSSGIPAPKQSYLYKFAIEELATNKMIEQEAESMGLLIDDETVLSYIIEESNKSGIDLTKERLERIMEENPSAIENLISSNRRKIFVETIKPAIEADSYGSQIAINYILGSRSEKRTYQLFQIDGRSIKSRPTPTQNELMEIYKSKADEFKTPKTKLLQYFSTGSLQKPPISNEEIIEYYNRSISSKSAPSQKRDVTIITFSNAQEAQKARSIINSGGISALNKEMGGASKESLQNASIEDFSPEVGTKIFSTEKNKPTPAIDAGGSFIVAITTKITKADQAGNQVSATSARKLVETEMKCQQSMEARKEIMTMISSGTSFEKISAKFKPKMKEVSIQEGNLGNADLSSNAIIEALNKPEGHIGMDDKTSGCDTTFFFVKKETPAGQIPFSQAQNIIQEHLKEEHIAQEIDKTYRSFVEQITKGGLIKTTSSSVESIATSKGINSIGKHTGNRSEAEQKANPYLLDAIFSAKEGQVVGPFKESENKIHFAVLYKIEQNQTSPHAQKETKAIEQEIKNRRSKDYANAYEKHLRDKYKIKISKAYQRPLEEE